MDISINAFIQLFAEQFEETAASDFSPETRFRDNDEWGSMLALSVMAMVNEEFDVALTANEMRHAETIKDLFDIVKSHL